MSISQRFTDMPLLQKRRRLARLRHGLTNLYAHHPYGYDRRNRRRITATPTAAASRPSLPGSGTEAMAAAGTTGAGNAAALPTVKLEPPASAVGLVRIN